MKTMKKLSDGQESALLEIGSQILLSLERVAQQAQAQLGKKPFAASLNSLATRTNPIVGGPQPERNLSYLRYQEQENLQRLEYEPFNARVVVRWEDETPPREETIYVSRASVAGIFFKEPIKLATYTAPLGRLAELKVGTTITMRVGSRERKLTILERVLLSPKLSGDEWDAIDNYFSFVQWKLEIESIRRFLRQVKESQKPFEEEIPDLLGTLLDEVDSTQIYENRRRKVIERMALRDQPILDQYQGEIFRKPLDQQIVLLGPPGTGKTTTLIRRIAQKRNHETLTPEEIETLSNAAIQKDFLNPDSWVMFTPTELLKVYLQKAFSLEGVPTRPNNLKTWEKERLHLGKNVLRILRSSESGRFQLEGNVEFLSDPSGTGVCQIYEEFAAYLDKEIFSRLKEAFHQLQVSNNENLKPLIRSVRGKRREEMEFSVKDIANLVEDSVPFQPEMNNLEDGVKQELKILCNRLLYTHNTLLEELIDSLPSVFGEELSEDEEASDSDTGGLTQVIDPKSDSDKKKSAVEILLRSLRTLARGTALNRSTFGGKAGVVINLLGERQPPRAALLQVGNRLLTIAHARSLIQSPQQFVMGVPEIYDRFRRQAVKDGKFYNSRTVDAVRQKRLSANETDILILAMLRNTRRLLSENTWRLAGIRTQDWLESIKKEYLMQVFVDEATDFSAVQLACTLELSHPRLRSWFACGDFNQRLTSYGTKNSSEIQWLNQPGRSSIQLWRINIAYRQSRRLRELTVALSTQDEDASTDLQAPENIEDTDIWPLLAEHHTGERLAQWLAKRVSEVERSVGKLPSVAVFVDGETLIDPLVEQLAPFLAVHNIPVVGCKDGRVVGDDLEVRIFNVQHIKGLEFEAVFFVGIDRIAERLPDLFDRFFYVGASRAGTYLGITCEGSLPPNLEPIRKYFSTENWQ